MQSGETALHLACRSSHLPVVLMLLEHVGDRSTAFVNTTNQRSETALHVAASRKAATTAKITLLDRDIVQVGQINSRKLLGWKSFVNIWLSEEVT